MRHRQQYILAYRACVIFIAVFLGPSVLASASQAQIMDDIQQQILSLRKEFKLRIEKKRRRPVHDCRKTSGKITNLLSTQESVYSSQPEIAKKIQQFRTLLDTYAAQMDSFRQITDAIEMTMHSSLDQIEQRFSQLRSRDTSPPPGNNLHNQSQTETIPEFAPGQFFRGVYRIFMDGDYETAITGFQKFLNDFPDSPLVGAAQYWIAEAFVRQGEYERALQEYDRLIKMYPSIDKIPDAYYGIGMALLKLGRPDEAQAQFRYVRDQFAGTLAAQKAQNRLQE